MARRLNRNDVSQNNTRRMDTEEERAAVYSEHSQHIDETIDRSRAMRTYHRVTDNMKDRFGWKNNRWNSYCADFVDSYHKDKTLRDADTRLSFYDVQQLIMHDYMDRTMRLACFGPLLMNGGLRGFGETLGRFLAYTATSKIIGRHDGVQALKRKKTNMEKYGHSSGKSEFDSFGNKNHYSQFSRPLTIERAAMQSIAFSTTTYHAMREEGADVNQLQEDWQAAQDALYEAAEADGLSRDDINKAVRTIAGQMFEADPETMSWFSEAACGQVARSEYVNVEHPDGTTTLEWNGEFFDMDTGEDFTDCFHPRPPQGLDAHLNNMRMYMLFSIEEYGDASEFIKDLMGNKDESGNFSMDENFIKRVGVIGKSMLDDGYSIEDVCVVAKMAAFESVCVYEANAKIQACNEVSASSDTAPMTVSEFKQAVNDACANDAFHDFSPEMEQYYKAYFNDCFQANCPDEFSKAFRYTCYHERPLHSDEEGPLVNYPDGFVPQFVVDFETLKFAAQENDCFDLNRAMPKNYKVDYEKGRSIARARYQYAQNRRSRENVGQADYVSEEPRQPEFIETTIVESSDDSYDNEM